MLASLAVYACLPMLIEPMADMPLSGMPQMLAAVAVMTAGLTFAIPRLLDRLQPQTGARADALLFQKKIIQWALCESIGIDGLVLYMLGAGTGWLWGFCAFGAALMGAHALRDEAPAADSRELARPGVKIG